MVPPGPAPRGSGHRRCPICDRATDDDLCPEDRMATLLIDAPRSDPTIIRVGSIIAGRYEVENVLGKGGFGAVFGARNMSTGQGVALKVLSSDEDDDLAMRRFFIEASVTSGLRHPNTIRVFDFGQDDNGLVYIAMERLNGRTLKQELRQRRKNEDGRVFSEQEAIEIGIAVTRSLGEAHAAGLVHRDLKPDNIFLHEVEGDDPVIKVIDFGIVRLQDSGLTRADTSGGGPGTPAFMSPEQAKNKALDGRGDLYSLGCILYQLVCGKVPFRGDTDVQTLYMHAHEDLPDIRDRTRVPISDAFADLVTQVLSKDPEQRFDDSRSMREALRDCLGQAQRSVFSVTATNPSMALDDEDFEQDTLHAPQPLLPPRRPMARAKPVTGPRRAVVIAAAAAFVVFIGVMLNVVSSSTPTRAEDGPIAPIPAIAPEPAKAEVASTAPAKAEVVRDPVLEAAARPARSTRSSRTARPSSRGRPAAPPAAPAVVAPSAAEPPAPTLVAPKRRRTRPKPRKKVVTDDILGRKI